MQLGMNLIELCSNRYRLLCVSTVLLLQEETELHQRASCKLFFENDPLKIVRGRAQYLYTEENKQLLDCINNVAHVGHSHPHVTKEAVTQMSLLSTNSRYLHDNIVLYAQRLTSYFPSKLSVCYFVNSGSEANDLALRIARNYTKNHDVIVLDGAYHGNLSLMTDISPIKFNKIENGFKDYVHVAPLPCKYRGLYRAEDFTDEEIGKKYADDVKKVIDKAHNKNHRIAAFIAESLVSCGGQIILPPGYLRETYKHVHQAGAITIADEVQSGFGRIGKEHMWAFQLQGEDICPDIVTIGKAMGNGTPCGCVVTTKDISESFFQQGVSYFNTFGGNPVSMAICNAVLDVLHDEKLQDNASCVGHFLLEELKKLMEKHRLIGDVRGVGFFIGVELVKNRETKEPACEEAAKIVSRMKDEGILLSAEGIHSNVLKFKPPMVFNSTDANFLIITLSKILSEIEGSISCISSECESESESLTASEDISTDDEIRLSSFSCSETNHSNVCESSMRVLKV